MSSSLNNLHFILRRLHSLLGLLPVGGFLLFHLWENSQSRFGKDHYNEYVVAKIQGMNYVQFLEIFVIALPILFHGLYGLVVWWTGKTNVTNYGYLRNWMWWLQRMSGIAILIFLGIHVGGTRILAEFRPEIAKDMFSHMQGLFIQPEIMALYIVGMLFSVFHLCNGLWTMSIVWGLASTAKSQKMLQWAALALFLLISAIGVHGVIGFLPR